MRLPSFALGLGLALHLAWAAAPVFPAEKGKENPSEVTWWSDLASAKKEALKSGKPIFLVTLWGPHL